MKVLFVTRGFPSEDDTMSGNYEAVQAKALAVKGCQASVISVREKEARYISEWRKISHRRVENVDVYDGIYIYTNIPVLRKFNRFIRNWSYNRVFNRYFEEKGEPDIVHAHIMLYAAYADHIIKKHNLPFVITEHWTQMNVPNIAQWLRELAVVYHHADQVICVSQALADSLKHNFHVDSIVINNMVSNLFFQTSKVERNDNQFKFIAIGAFRKNKGFDILVEAFALSHFSKNVKLNIVGDGEEREYVESKIKELGISEQVKILGTKTPEKVNELLCLSDCFVLSSRLETFAIVVIEAMAKGLPVIATRSGGPETFIRPEHGILVEKENVEELSDAMRRMVNNSTNYDALQIRKFCHDNYSQDVIVNKLIDVYKRVISCENRTM